MHNIPFTECRYSPHSHYSPYSVDVENEDGYLHMKCDPYIARASFRFTSEAQTENEYIRRYSLNKIILHKLIPYLRVSRFKLSSSRTLHSISCLFSSFLSSLQLQQESILPQREQISRRAVARKHPRWADSKWSGRELSLRTNRNQYKRIVSISYLLKVLLH